MLNCSSSWCQNDSVLISIDYIKLANKKLLEGVSYKKIVIAQDSIIQLQSEKYAALEAEASVLQTKLYNVNRVNVKLTDKVDKQNRKVRFLGGTALASTLAFLLCIILK
jgi:hypothetical protein